MVKAPNHVHQATSSTPLFRSDSYGSEPSLPGGVSLLEAVIEGFVDGILILTDQGEILHANTPARQWGCLPSRLPVTFIQPGASASLSQSIWRVCQALIESRTLFSGQTVVPEAEVVLNDIPFRIRAQWLDTNPDLSEWFRCARPCLLVTLENRLYAMQQQAIADQRKYGLTSRETEVWLLRLQGYSYQEIATRLCVTNHTIHKHVRSILAKRRIL